MQKVAAVVLLVLVTSSIAFAQETTGAMNGRVIDAQGLPVPGAAVSVTGSRGVKSAVTNTDGRFAVPFLTPGTYAVEVNVTGFRKWVRDGVILQVNQRARVDVTPSLF